MRIYSCLVVDDEPLIVRRLEKMFEKWAAGASEFRLAGSAYSAQEAEDIALRLKPDLIITDIVMPGRNGIELIAVLKPKLPQTVFVVLSAYSEFAYAKQAISMDVLDYLIKVPLSEKGLLETLHKAKKKLEAVESNRQELTQFNQQRRENLYRLRKQIIEEICVGESSPSMLERLRESLMIKLPMVGTYVCLAFKIDRFTAFRQKYSAKDQKLYRFGIMNIIEEIIHEEEGILGFCSELGAGRFVALLVSKHVHSLHQLENEYRRIGRNMVYCIGNYLNVSVSAGISSPFRSLAGISGALNEAGQRLDDCFYSSKGCVKAPSAKPAFDKNAEFGIRSIFDELEEAICKPDAVSLNRLLNQLHETPARTPIEPKILLAMGRDFWARLASKLPSEAVIGNWTATVSTAIETDFEEWFAAIAQACEACLQSGHLASREREEIRKSKAFIEAHLGEQLYLEVVAAHVNMNPTYFSELFKREVGEGFSEYVGRKRIDKAVELLRLRDLNNRELAEAVGIESEKYLCTLFKKYVGVTPQKFSRAIQTKE